VLVTQEANRKGKPVGEAVWRRPNRSAPLTPHSPHAASLEAITAIIKRRGGRITSYGSSAARNTAPGRSKAKSAALAWHAKTLMGKAVPWGLNHATMQTPTYSAPTGVKQTIRDGLERVWPVFMVPSQCFIGGTEKIKILFRITILRDEIRTRDLPNTKLCYRPNSDAGPNQRRSQTPGSYPRAAMICIQVLGTILRCNSTNIFKALKYEVSINNIGSWVKENTTGIWNKHQLVTAVPDHNHSSFWESRETHKAQCKWMLKHVVCTATTTLRRVNEYWITFTPRRY
jgi:hypothetical protein